MKKRNSKIIKKLAKMALSKDKKNQILHDAAHLLHDQARILEGEPVIDPQGFARRMSSLMTKGLSI